MTSSAVPQRLGSLVNQLTFGFALISSLLVILTTIAIYLQIRRHLLANDWSIIVEKR